MGLLLELAKAIGVGWTPARVRFSMTLTRTGTSQVTLTHSCVSLVPAPHWRAGCKVGSTGPCGEAAWVSLPFPVPRAGSRPCICRGAASSQSEPSAGIPRASLRRAAVLPP